MLELIAGASMALWRTSAPESGRGAPALCLPQSVRPVMWNFAAWVCKPVADHGRSQGRQVTVRKVV